MSPTMKLLSQFEHVDNATPFAFAKTYVSSLSTAREIGQTAQAKFNAVTTLGVWKHSSNARESYLNVLAS